MKTLLRASPALLLLAAACVGVTPAPGTRLSEVSHGDIVNDAMRTQVAFDHRCAPERIRVIRADTATFATTVDLDVCGAVRRYKAFMDLTPGESVSRPTWVDVTSLYPASSLPAALSPASP